MKGEETLEEAEKRIGFQIRISGVPSVEEFSGGLHFTDPDLGLDITLTANQARSLFRALETYLSIDNKGSSE